jgi:hypothetical protein
VVLRMVLRLMLLPVRCDPIHLLHVIMNLVMNGHGRDGGRARAAHLDGQNAPGRPTIR